MPDEAADVFAAFSRLFAAGELSFDTAFVRLCSDWLFDRSQEQWAPLIEFESTATAVDPSGATVAIGRLTTRVAEIAAQEKMTIAIELIITEIIALAIKILTNLMTECGQPPSDQQLAREFRAGTRRVKSALTKGYRQHSLRLYGTLPDKTRAVRESVDVVTLAFGEMPLREAQTVVRDARRIGRNMVAEEAKTNGPVVTTPAGPTTTPIGTASTGTTVPPQEAG